MKRIRKITSFALLTLAVNAHSGLYKTTVHSRANCLNNESITWWYNHPFNWRVVSVHHQPPNGTTHTMDTGFNYNSRVAAIHWGEGSTLHAWEVWGYHFLYEYNKKIPFDTTYANFCSFIEGW